MVPIAIAIMTYKDKIVVMHRDNNPAIKNPNKWGLIGGHVEEGESFEQGLVREVKEESDTDVTDYTFWYQVIMEREGENVDYHFYHVPLNDTQASQVKLMNEGQSVEFKTLSELQGLDLTNSLINLLNTQEYRKKLEEILSTSN